LRTGSAQDTYRERYPLTSQLIQENKIPEFGAPFVSFWTLLACSLAPIQTISTLTSMASFTTVPYTTIFHLLLADSDAGSHPNDEDAHFRLSEEQIFTSIFTYVDHLFEKIKPKKVFFMAVDGVAPRAKMNQQRSRRFRTAKEAREVREKAEARGEELPAEKAFDSNCITPGTATVAARIIC
jgi:5'-3' exoribonuclease 1